jgi:GAF domain-containing protein
MAGGAKPSRLRVRVWHSGAVLALALGEVCFPARAQPVLSLAELARRNPADQFAPAHLGETVVVLGVASGSAFQFPDYTLLAIQDGEYGAVVQVSGDDRRLDTYRAGDHLEVEGQVAALAGMVVVRPTRVVSRGRKPAPVPIDVPINELEGFRHLGRLVRTEGRVKTADAAADGIGLYVTFDAPGFYRVFIPYKAPPPAAPSGIRPGDRVRAVGIAYQYCRQPPYNRSYQLLAHDPGSIVPMERTWHLSPTALAIALSVILFISFFLWSRERRLRNQRETLRKTYQLGEEILGASSAQAILKRIRETLPAILGVSRVQLYVYNRASKTLEAVAEEGGYSNAISLSVPPGGTQAGAVACFHYRTLLVIPDIERSPFPITAREGDQTPRSLLLVPMMAQGEVAGVLELDQDDRVRDFSAGEQELAQHLGNQIGVAIRLLDQRSVQEQLFRTEKLAAVGRLISGVVNELQTPLSSITDLAQRALEKSFAGAAEREVRAIWAESQKAAGMVARLVSFAAAEQVEARPVSISALLRNLIDFRESDWKASGIRVRDLTTREPLFVLGSQGQLEQCFLNLLVHAEQWLADAPQKVITIRTSVLGKRLLIEISFTARAERRKAEETAAVLGVTRSVIGGHGGEVRLIEKSNADPRFEVELPVSAKERSISSPAVAASGGRVKDFAKRMTALVIEPDDAAQRQILGLLAARGFRVVPVDNSDTGLELAHRMRFDAAFCSVHAPGLNWVELSERLHSRTGGFILLSDGYDTELQADFEGEGRFVLAKPVQETELDRVLRMLEPALPAVKNGVA